MKQAKFYKSRGNTYEILFDDKINDNKKYTDYETVITTNNNCSIPLTFLVHFETPFSIDKLILCTTLNVDFTQSIKTFYINFDKIIYYYNQISKPIETSDKDIKDFEHRMLIREIKLFDNNNKEKYTILYGNNTLTSYYENKIIRSQTSSPQCGDIGFTTKFTVDDDIQFELNIKVLFSIVNNILNITKILMYIMNIIVKTE